MALLKPTNDFRYYVYVSSSKLKMLYEQLRNPVPTKRAIKWNFKLPVVSITRSSTKMEQRSGRDEMLKQVEKALKERDQIGSLADPKSYIKDVFPVRWGIYNDCQTRPDDEPALVYFGGFANNLLLGMGGSSCHVEGHSGATGTWSRSSTPTLTRWLLSGLHSGKAPKDSYCVNIREEENEVFRAMAVAQYYLRPPTQKVEFLAKTIAIGEVRGMESFINVEKAKAILATPLYVAQYDINEVHRINEVPVWGLTERDWQVERRNKSKSRRKRER